ncbi:uncharacterized protein M421DRAFT_109174 [Didymella exigua CBS 183.55]|uniref:Uncharacterized protein n=1 Tax=Didymella exigua CBS 183.55 TaxID=1150837 RepID=A0A6A5S2U5_9PLEO|nr:uncharacterized protein M421DRAFT_109174 [Didymella exigua CBS 183.55]KAF1933950.1 hypothetical protein M421DRAFT_109174 [Didymella exigua CBS 183.55]
MSGARGAGCVPCWSLKRRNIKQSRRRLRWPVLRLHPSFFSCNPASASSERVLIPSCVVRVNMCSACHRTYQCLFSLLANDCLTTPTLFFDSASQAQRSTALPRCSRVQRLRSKASIPRSTQGAESDGPWSLLRLALTTTRRAATRLSMSVMDLLGNRASLYGYYSQSSPRIVDLLVHEFLSVDTPRLPNIH